MKNTENITSPAIRYLSHKKIPFNVFVHPHNIISLEEAARERNQTLHQIIKSIVFRYSQNQFVLVLTNADVDIDWKKLRHVLGIRRITLAKPAEIHEVLGYEIGAVSPFPPNYQMLTLINYPVLDEPIISLGSGVKNVALIMKNEHLLSALKEYKVVDLAKIK